MSAYGSDLQLLVGGLRRRSLVTEVFWLTRSKRRSSAGFRGCGHEVKGCGAVRLLASGSVALQECMYFCQEYKKHRIFQRSKDNSKD